MPTLCIDYETAFSKDYSLTTLTSTEYIRDSRFEAIMCGFKLNDEPTHVAVGEDIQKAFSFYKGIDVGVAFNAAFDGAIAAERYNWKPQRWVDPMGLARAGMRLKSNSLASVSTALGLAPKLEMPDSVKGKWLKDLSKAELEGLAVYCKRDTDLAKAIYDCLIGGFSEFELKLLNWTVEAVISPLLEVDVAMLEGYVIELQKNRTAVLAGAGITLPEIMSNPKFALALQNLGVSPPMKISPRTGKETFAFSKKDQGLLELQTHPDLRVQTVVSARLQLKSTIEETRAARLSAIGRTGPLPVPLLYGGAHTGRLSGTGGVNLQNLSRGSKLRDSLIAPQGYTLIVGDSAQIEARVLAVLAEQTDLVDSFRKGEDIYCEMASFIYGRPITKADELERWLGKSVILGAGYGMSAQTFEKFLVAQGKPLASKDWYTKAINAYRKKNANIVKLWNRFGTAIPYIAREDINEFNSGGLSLKLGQYRLERHKGRIPLLYPSLRRYGSEWIYNSTEREVNKIYGGKLTENVVQALARDIVMEQLLEVHSKYPVVMAVHDEIIAIAPESEGQKAADFMLKVMSTPPYWWPDLPVKAEVGHGRIYGELK